ncbi:MAG: hypothetical protein QG656_220 [Candidatus Hydrogenedentes bacterium]|nr:hypothetical protein [Candidatus Hydrogenedentota bacterium]
MKVLHLFSNAKWTGPAEPALNLCVTLRRHGVETDFACAPDARASINKVVETARDRGIEPLLDMHLSKHRHLLKNAHDKRVLTRRLKTGGYDLIHCHLDNDHTIALGTASKRGIPIVRSSYEGEGFPVSSRHRALLRATAGLVEPSQRALEHDARAFAFPIDRMRVVPNAVDVTRFDPARELPDGRRWLGIPNDAFVVGIVARMQTHRHYEDFFQVLRRLADAHPHLHAIVVGRGTKQDQVAYRPVKSLSLEKAVHFPGFVDGENYVGVLKAFDVKVFLVPGSDGTCRAVREAMAMGKPAVVADRGMLSEIVEHGQTGLVCDGSADGLFDALNALAGDRAYTRKLGRAAREKAFLDYSLDAQAVSVKRFYEALLATR